MPGKKLRNLFSLHDKYQRQMIAFVIIPLLIISTGLFVVVFKMDEHVTQLINMGAYATIAAVIGQWFYVSICFIYALSIIILIMIFYYSRNLVNPFKRILRETDEVLAGGPKKMITARPDDELANEVVQRINELIKRMN